MRWPSPWRWVVVVCGTAVLCAVPAIVAALPVPGSQITAAALRARILGSEAVSYEGYAESTSDLGLPVLPDLQDVSRLLDGTTDQYAWYRSPAHWRADTLTAAGEDDVYQICRRTILWNHAYNLLTRVVGSQQVRLPRAADLLPPALARRLLGLAAGADRLSRLPSLRVAGIAAAGLRLVPATAATSVAAIDIWADPATGLPVEVQVFARGTGHPILVSKFLQLGYHRPGLAMLVPHPAPDVDQTTARLSSLNGILNGARRHPWPHQLGGLPLSETPGGPVGVAFYGAGLGRFALLPLPGRTGARVLAAATSAGAAALPLPDGSGVLVRTPLLTVVLATSERFGGITFLLAGPVTARVLEGAASDLLTLIERLR
jgi:hypothetical protein